MNVICNDCLEKSEIPFHIYGGKCRLCKSYNTTRIGTEQMAENYINSKE